MSVDSSVQAAVLAWANAPDTGAAAKSLTASSKLLSAKLREQLASEVADITVESVVNLLLAGPTKPAEPIATIGRLALDNDQLQSLAAWSRDLDRTGYALGLQKESWLRALEGAMQRMLPNSEAQEAKRDAVERAKAVHAFLGQAPRALHKDAGNAVSGVVSQLAARINKPR